MRSPTSEEKRKFHRCDAVLIGFDQKAGWKGELPFYKFKCDKHGEQIDYPHGYSERLSCEKCDIAFHEKNKQNICSCSPYLANCSVPT